MPDPVRILVSRAVLPDRRDEYEAAVRRWIPEALRFPGHLGVVLLRPGPGSDDYATLLRFSSLHDWERFQAWPPYLDFLQSLRPLLAHEPTAEPLHGLETWFLPAGHAPPPRWKMFLLTLLGVNAAVLAMSTAVAALPGPWHPALRFLTVNALVVAALTWAVMPLLTRLAAPWLRGAPR